MVRRYQVDESSVPRVSAEPRYRLPVEDVRYTPARPGFSKIKVGPRYAEPVYEARRFAEGDVIYSPVPHAREVFPQYAS